MRASLHPVDIERPQFLSRVMELSAQSSVPPLSALRSQALDWREFLGGQGSGSWAPQGMNMLTQGLQVAS